MTTIHAQLIGGQAVLPRGELDRLLELARRSETVDLQLLEDDLPTLGVMRLAEQGGAFDFWREEGEDIYTIQDGEPLCLVDLAEDCRKLGKTDEARVHLLRARSLLERLYPPDDPRVATTILGLGEVAEDAGDFDRARAFYREAVAIRRRSLGPDHPFLAEALADYARALMLTGNMGDAVEASLEAESIRRALLRYTVRALPERQALSYEGRLVSGLDVAVAAGVRTWDSTLVERVWDSVVRSRGVVLDEMASRHHWSDALGDSASDDLVAGWTEARQRLAHLAVRGRPQPRSPATRDGWCQVRVRSR
jgi:tetratricopeptide (TPR) repeat protein